MHSLFWRIFLTFWLALALILVGTVTVAVDAALKWRNERPSLPYQEIYTRAAQVFEAGGGDALKQWIQELSPPALRERTFVLDSSGHDLLERPLPSYPQTSREGQPSRLRLPTEPIGRSLMLVGPDGKAFRVVVVAGPNRGPIHRFGELELPGVRAATLIIALVVSAVICFFLARYLTAPVDRLRDATQRIAAGDLNVRVLPSLKGRKDELGVARGGFRCDGRARAQPSSSPSSNCCVMCHTSCARRLRDCNSPCRSRSVAMSARRRTSLASVARRTGSNT